MPNPARHNVDWTREEQIIAFNLYCRLPFGRLNKGNPEIIKLAALLGRTPSSVSMKLCNFARLDPALQARGIKGLTSGAKGEVLIWEEFLADPERLAYESARLLAERTAQTIEIVADIVTSDLPPEGKEREAIVRLRVNQSFFRKRVVSAYEFRCCVTGLNAPELLVASHIVPWAADPKQRLNPRNGLCLNALHDRAFDRGLMWIEDDFTIRFSPRLHAIPRMNKVALAWLTASAGKTLLLPKQFSPDTELLQRHRGKYVESLEKVTCLKVQAT